VTLSKRPGETSAPWTFSVDVSVHAPCFIVDTQSIAELARNQFSNQLAAKDYLRIVTRIQQEYPAIARSCNAAMRRHKRAIHPVA
jgi:hypothetical protein